MRFCVLCSLKHSALGPSRSREARSCSIYLVTTKQINAGACTAHAKTKQKFSAESHLSHIPPSSSGGGRGEISPGVILTDINFYYILQFRLSFVFIRRFCCHFLKLLFEPMPCCCCSPVKQLTAGNMRESFYKLLMRNRRRGNTRT